MMDIGRHGRWAGRAALTAAIAAVLQSGDRFLQKYKLHSSPTHRSIASIRVGNSYEPAVGSDCADRGRNIHHGVRANNYAGTVQRRK